MPDLSTLDDLFSRLFCGDDEKAECAVQELAALSGEALENAFDRLSAALDSYNSDQRWWATRAMAALSHPRVSQELLRSLEDPNADVRQCAALGLRLHAPEEAVNALVAHLADEDPMVARLSGDALTAIGEAAVPQLIETLQSENLAARLEAVRALAHIKDERAIPALMAALDDSAMMEYWADEGLERLGVGMVFYKP